MHRTKKEIIGIANAALMSGINSVGIQTIDSLEIDEELFFWFMFNIGGARLTGHLPKDDGRHAQNRANHHFDRFAVKIKLLCDCYNNVIDNWRKCSLKISEFSKELNSEDPDGEAAATILVEAFDALTNDNVYIKMIYRIMKDPEFKKKFVDTLIKNQERITGMFGDELDSESYVKLEEAFYKACVDSGTAAVFNEFGKQPGMEEHFETVSADVAKKAIGNIIDILKDNGR